MFSGMATRIFARMIALCLVASLLVGCAEVDRRGGVADQIQDYLFKADSKSHRLLRSYLLVGVLLAVAQRQGVNDVDRTAIKGALEGALSVANEAFSCLYPGTFESNYEGHPPELEIIDWTVQPAVLTSTHQLPKWCQFFDEKMARLDHAIFRLATVTLFGVRDRDQFVEIRDRMIGRVPVLSDTLKAAISANRVVNQTTTLIDDLLNLSFASLGPVTTLLPLYRDALELNSWIIVDSMAMACVVTRGETSMVLPAAPASGVLDFDRNNPCDAYRYAVLMAAEGNAEPAALRAFITYMYQVPVRVEAYRPHFYVVSRLIGRSCLSVLGKEQCDTALTYALEKSALYINNAYSQPRGKIIASLFPGSMIASNRPKPTRTVRRPATDPVATGTITPAPAAPSAR
ncbi:hypothetical protein E0H22_06935 [Rhodopseudomonas boonkerdii]|uniref:hypothetical protein n=1 Tax=Rhodopseudomonas boonkerdii TaxID=475937 RepID=UPI001E2BC598|nr:hypothetical protein [Rhodopseudomonas boonkerdii]UGV25441.1 hypothetical protein E0H22_06935 [Rhodopseudomonas boonkerdii]